MLRTSILKTALQRIFFALFLIFSLSSVSKADEMGITILTSPASGPGSEVTATFYVSGFTDILSMQFSIGFDESELSYQSVQDFQLAGLSNGSFGNPSNNPGYLPLSWFDPNTTGLSKADCTPIFTVTFESINGNVPFLEIGNVPTIIEVVNGDWDQVDLIQNLACGGVGMISGNIFHDVMQDCLYSLDEEGMNQWKVKFEGNGSTFYASTNSDGDYLAYLLPETYAVSVVLPQNGLWTACQQSQTIVLLESGAETQDFPVQALFECPSLSVDLSAMFLRRCFNSNYVVHYCNDGTITAEDAYVEVEFDAFLEVQASSIPWTTVDGNTYTFPLGDIEVGDCGDFTVTVEVSCDAVLGQTHCSEAHIFPDIPCIPVNPLWDGSHLDVTSTCDGDTVRFQIINTGDDMTEPVEFIVIQDEMIYLTSDPILLTNMEAHSLAMEADGSTWRIETPQTPHNPFATFAADAVEGCGTNGSGDFSTGFVTQFPSADENPAVDEDCQENIGSYDPNDKIGYPKGFCGAHYIRPEQDIEYRIRFQNTGTDIAFNIAVYDTLSSLIDPASVRPGSSSHPYEFELLGEGVVKFTFPNIMLPDSNANEPASHGFIKFTVSQKPGNPIGSIINNQAAIFFDFNDPVYTNTYTHTIGDNFVEMGGQSGDLSVSGFVHTWWGDPLEGTALTLTNLCPVFSDADGFYLHENVDTANYNHYASKANPDFRKGISILDMVKTSQHILGIMPFDNAFQVIAGDFNGSNTISTLDIVHIRKVILGLDFNNLLTQWKFVTKDFDPSLPIMGGSTQYTYNPLNTSLDEQDFIAIQPGNPVPESIVPLSSTNTEFYFEAIPGTDPLELAVKAHDFTNVNGFQFGLAWDPSVLAFKRIESSAIFVTPDVVASPSPGSLNLVILANYVEGLTFPSDETLFTLVFQELGSIGNSTTLILDETNIPMLVVVDTCKLAEGSIIPETIVVQNPSAIIDLEEAGLHMTILPNPLSENEPLNIDVRTKNAQTLNLEFYDIKGTLVQTNEEHFQTGKTKLQIPHDFDKGIYFLKVSNSDGLGKTAKLMVY